MTKAARQPNPLPRPERIAGASGRPPRAPVAGVHRLIEAQARRTPGAPAVIASGRELSYGELDARADRLAHRLRGLGVGPEARVALCLRRSPELVVGLLAVLKAGGAFVPLDPGTPAGRLAFLLGDSRPSVVLASGDDPPPGVVPDGVPTLRVDADAPAVARDRAAEAEAVLPENAAYVIYTSGSTGRPKGVVVPHGALARHCAAAMRRYELGPRDRVLQFASPSFDAALEQILPPLIAGASVVLADATPRDPADFHAQARALGLTVVNLPPAFWRQAAEAWPPDADDHAVRLVILGGDVVTPRDVALWRLGPLRPARFLDAYGPTETTITATTFEADPLADDDPPGARVPIGRPLAGRTAYVLAPNLRPVPVGVQGELYLGGRCLARGYLDRPALTAERFLPDPFGPEPGGRLYRTGDLARWLPGGDLEFLGRADHQVKVRGFRIELGEVEAALGEVPGVRLCAAIADQGPGDARLVAFVEPEAGAAPDARGLARSLAAKLPGYMVPSVFVVLPGLPLTAGGKVDRPALAALGPFRVEGGADYVAPRTEAERGVAAIWAEVLGVDRVGADDHFFELGGHSLLATRVVSRVRQAFAANLPLRALFEAPTLKGLAARVDAAREQGRGRADGPIVPAPREAEATARPSFAQQALWYLDRLEPGRPTFNVTSAVRVAGPLDVDALMLGLREMIGRHDALRTTFPAVDGRPMARVSPDWDLDLPEVDLAHLPEAERMAEAGRIAEAEARRPFDLAEGPLLRATLIRLAPDDHAVLLSMHHIITDGWSFGVAAAELSALYEAFHEGRPSPLPPLPIQYADYAHWQHERLRGGLLDGLVGYWTGRLAGLPPLELPTDRPRPPVRSGRGALKGFALSPELSDAVRELCRSEQVTPFMALLAAFQVLLSRYSGQVDFAVGSPSANRGRAEVEGLIGYFINMLTLRADLSGDPTFRDVLGRVREAALGAFEHQELPFDALVETLRPRRDPSRTPLFQVMFVLQNNQRPEAPRLDLELGTLDTLGGGSGTAKFDLSLGLAEGDGGFSGSLEYSTDLFDAATAGRIIGHFTTLLAAAAADPGRRVADLDPLTPEERGQILDDWNRTDAPLPAGACVHHLVEAQARRTPEAEAVVGDGGSLSYRELDRRANRLARHLGRLGVGPESRVGVCLHRSPDLLVALLAVLKAGGAFVPLDPDYPRERLRFMLADAGVAALVARGDLRDLVSQAGAPVVDLDRDAQAIEQEPADAPDVAASPSNAAYVIYTSGSTGVPKGVVVSHRGVANHNLAAARLFGLGAGDRVLQFCSASFDIAVEEIFPAWISGASVVLRDDGFLDPARFARLVAEAGITVLDLPTAFWHAWAKAQATLGEPLPASLRLVVVGGEEASGAVFSLWRGLAGDRVRWINTYGPTEGTVIATAFQPEGDHEGSLPIGRPIANARVYVLDPASRPVPVGLPGELYLGGEGVARGYLGRPAATAERFVPDPFGDRPGGRLYRTGDRVRWDADGRLVFLGRVDDQAKVRGFRVEPGEVEAALLARPDVREAAVVVRDDALVAYAAGAGLDAEALRRDLKGRLPRHLVPASFVVLDALPITPSGKVDRRALPEPGPVEARPGGVRAPSDPIEAQLLAIWEEVLDGRRAGVADDFFDLGGHSLLAVRLLARVEERFGRRVALADLIQGPTVEELAALIRGEDRPRPWSHLVHLGPGGPGAPFFCVHAVGGGVAGYHDLARLVGRDRPFVALQAAGVDAGTTPLDSVEAMAARYLAEVRARQPAGPYHLGGWSMGGVVAFEMARQLREAGEEVAALVLVDSHVPHPGFAPESEADVRAAFDREMARASGDRDDLVATLAPDRVDRLRDVYRAHCRALNRYQPRPDPVRLTLARASASRGEPDLGWGAVATGGVDVHELAGDHDSLVRPPAVEALAALVERAISGSEGAGRR